MNQQTGIKLSYLGGDSSFEADANGVLRYMKGVRTTNRALEAKESIVVVDLRTLFNNDVAEVMEYALFDDADFWKTEGYDFASRLMPESIGNFLANIANSNQEAVSGIDETFTEQFAAPEVNADDNIQRAAPFKMQVTENESSIDPVDLATKLLDMVDNLVEQFDSIKQSVLFTGSIAAEDASRIVRFKSEYMVFRKKLKALKPYLDSKNLSIPEIRLFAGVDSATAYKAINSTQNIPNPEVVELLTAISKDGHRILVWSPLPKDTSQALISARQEFNGVITDRDEISGREFMSSFGAVLPVYRDHQGESALAYYDLLKLNDQAGSVAGMIVGSEQMITATSDVITKGAVAFIVHDSFSEAQTAFYPFLSKGFNTDQQRRILYLGRGD